MHYSLKEGLGARRLKQATVRAHVQSLLVQSCLSVFQAQRSIMPPAAVQFLKQSVSEICHNARQVCFSLCLIPGHCLPALYLSMSSLIVS